MRRTALPLVLTCLAVLSGCGTRRFTDTPRTASEQLLVSAAVDQACAQLNFDPLSGKKVFVDDRFVDRVDKTFLVATIRMRGMEKGVLFVEKAEEASHVLELRSGAVGVDRDEYVLGIPESAIPSPGGAVTLPEAAAFKSVNQHGATRVSFAVYQRENRQFVYASGPAYGFSKQNSRWFFGAGPVIQDNVAPEKTGRNTADAQSGSASAASTAPPPPRTGP
jgi:hypothetical protein